GENEQGFDQIKPVNLIIGRNNSGKSTLIDLVEYAVKGKIDAPEAHWYSKRQPELVAEAPLSEEELQSIFSQSTSGGVIPGRNHWELGSRLVGAKFIWNPGAKKDNKFISIGDCLDGSRPFDRLKKAAGYLQRIANEKSNPLRGKMFRR